MKSATGRWVSGADFFDRESELQILKSRIIDYNHVLLTGQRRMGKTSITRELGRHLEQDGWLFLFADVEAATSAEDAIDALAEAVRAVQPLAKQLISTAKRVLHENVEELSLHDFGVKFREGVNEGIWRRYGEELLADCAGHPQPVLLVIDELPIFLKHMLQYDNGRQRVDEFLRWLRSVLQRLTGQSLAVIISGSIGLQPLTQQLGIPDRINYLYPFRLGPWSRDDSVACFRQLAESYQVPVVSGVAEAVYKALGIGIPHHVQFFFARLRDHATMQGRDCIVLSDVDQVYRHELLGPSGQSDLMHYETRLKEGIGDDKNYALAMEILAEAAIQNSFTADARYCLMHLYAKLVSDASERIAGVLDVLEHDGYLEQGDDGHHQFISKLLKDWWRARFQHHYVPLQERGGGIKPG